MNIVYVFSMEGCPHCKSLKKRLNEMGIKFKDIDVDLNQKMWDNVVEQTNNEYLPTVFIKNKNSNSGPSFCPERDFKNEDELIKLIEKNLNS